MTARGIRGCARRGGRRFPRWCWPGVAMVIAFIVTAGPLALTSAGDRATRQAIAIAPPADVGAQLTADYRTAPGSAR